MLNTNSIKFEIHVFGGPASIVSFDYSKIVISDANQLLNYSMGCNACHVGQTNRHLATCEHEC